MKQQLMLSIFSYIRMDQWVDVVIYHPLNWVEIIDLIRKIEHEFGCLLIPDLLRKLKISIGENLFEVFNQLTVDNPGI